MLRWEYAEVVELAYTTDLKSVSYGFESHLPYQPKGKWTLALYVIKIYKPKKRIAISTKLSSPQFGSVAQLVEQQKKREV